ncbi:MAG: phosphoribosyltransferase family protein [Peptoniphilaceae bacterium]|nr:phosphoribosyltransferase family protein [Peptoniphilaceae bacterium]MDY6019103.1 phosphoribosyltransferase family protein [Anaerococcus sp.]
MIDFLFLDKNICYSCKSEEISRFFLCDSCLSKLDLVDNNFKIDGYDAYAIYFYNKFMANMIGSYKFNRNTSLYRVFGSLVEFYIKNSKDLSFDFDYILPAPSSKSTLNRRGFDHIRLITDYFVEKNKMRYLDSFKKIKETKVQHSLSLEDRQKNLRGAFSCHEDLTGKKILIFDDIITSGNTVREMIRVLEKCKPSQIKILALSSSHKVK